MTIKIVFLTFTKPRKFSNLRGFNFSMKNIKQVYK